MKEHDRVYIDKLAQRVFVALIPIHRDCDAQELTDKAVKLATDYFWHQLINRCLKGLSLHDTLRLILEADGITEIGIKSLMARYNVAEPLKAYSNDKKYGGGKTNGQQAVKRWLENNEEPLF